MIENAHGHHASTKPSNNGAVHSVGATRGANQPDVVSDPEVGHPVTGRNEQCLKKTGASPGASGNSATSSNAGSCGARTEPQSLYGGATSSARSLPKVAIAIAHVAPAASHKTDFATVSAEPARKISVVMV